MCNTKFGFQGYECNRWSSESVAILIIGILVGIAGLVLFLFSCVILGKILAIKRSKTAVNPVSITLLFSALGNLCFLGAALSMIITALAFPMIYDEVTENSSSDRVIKRSPQTVENAVAIFVALAFCLSMCAVIVLPLTWVG